MAVEASARRMIRRVAYDSLRSFPSLFGAYCSHYESLSDFFAGDFRDADARRLAADRAAKLPRDRQTLADVLLVQNAQWGLDAATRENIEALRDPETVAVVTGQQVGFLASPAYTPYKTITALQLAARLAVDTGRRVVPVFWLEGEDHDLDEVAHVHLPGSSGLESFVFRPERLDGRRNPGPVGHLPISPDIGPLLDEIERALRPTDFTADVMGRVRVAYAPGSTLLDGFARLLRTLLPASGLVFVNPDDQRLKRLASPLFEREIRDHEGSLEAFTSVTRRLELHFHAQVTARPTNLFMLEPEGRLAVDAEGDGFRLRGTARRIARSELLGLLDAEPERFSPNVITRPLMQDLLFPTACYVAGPGEISYFAQYGGVYRWAEIPMPVIYPRASVTLVEPFVRRLLDRHGLGLADVQDEPEQVFQRVVLAMLDVDISEAFTKATTGIEEMMDGLRPAVERVDPTLGKTAEATRTSLVKELDRLRDRVVRAEKRQHDELRGQIERASMSLFPRGKPQERVLSVLHFANKYGPALIDEMSESLSLDTTAHQVVEI
jgi:bacillithiol synthase